MNTEKKKRGRPPGSGKKNALASKVDFKYTTAESFDSDNVAGSIQDEHPMYVTSKLEKVVEFVDDIERAKKAIAKLKKTDSPEPPYPSNWNEMGKLQKLEWLTANPRK